MNFFPRKNENNYLKRQDKREKKRKEEDIFRINLLMSRRRVICNKEKYN